MDSERQQPCGHHREETPADQNSPVADGGDPVNLLSGAAWTRATDIAIPCPGLDLVLRRHYQSRLVVANSPFGARWTHSLDAQLLFAKNTPLLGRTAALWILLSTGDGHYGSFPHGTVAPGGAPPETAIPLPGGAAGYASVALDDVLGPQPIPASGLRPWASDADLTLKVLPNAWGWTIEFPGGGLVSFGADGAVERVSLAAGQSLDFDRGSARRLTRVRHSSGQSIVFEYNDAGRISRASVPGQRLAVDYGYSGSDLESARRTTSAGTTAESYGYAPGHYLTTKTIASGLSFHHTYTNVPSLHPGDADLVLAATAWGGEPRYYDLAATYLTATSSVARVFRDEFSFDTFYVKNPSTDQPLLIRYPVGETARFDYNPVTRLLTYSAVSTTAGDYAHVALARDADSRVIEARAAFNASLDERPMGWDPAWRLTYDETCRLPATFTDPCGRLTGTDYDALGRPTADWADLAPNQRLTERYTYGADRLLATYQDPAGRNVAYFHGLGGYVTNIVPAVGSPATYRWNTALGILTNVTLAGPGGPRVFSLDRDELGRTRRVTLPGGHGTATFAHDVSGRLTNEVDTAGRVTRQTWHPAGKLASHSRQAGPSQWATVRFDYGQQMDTLAIRDPLDRTVERYALDGMGRATNVWDIENRRMDVRYLLGDLVARIDRFDGSTVTFDYDTGANLSRERYPDGDRRVHLPGLRPPRDRLQRRLAHRLAL